MIAKQEWLKLAERCEKATGPDREIDCVVFVLTTPSAFGGQTARDLYARTNWTKNRADWNWLTNSGMRPYTASLDAITALIERELPGLAWFCNFIHAPGYPPCNGDIWRPSIRGAEVPSIGRDRFRAGAATPALALCAAFCRAMAERSQS